MDARNNLANQEVFSMARAADPVGKRTVGIITKCDALQEGDEDGVLRIAKNQVEKLTHGWFVVRNRSTKEINEGVTVDGRHQIERDFFVQAHPWKELQKDRVGIDALKGFLGHLLYDHIRSEFPAVIKDIESLLRETERDLELLGLPRQSAADQRRFLMRLIGEYQKQVYKALNWSYDEALDAQSPLKLRMLVRKVNDQFALLMSRKGHAKIFRTIQGKIDSDFKRQEQETENIYDWIRRYYIDSRGPELPGVVNPVVIENMFRQQSSPWESLGNMYINTITEKVRDFNNHVLELIVPDDEVRANLRALLSPREQENKRQALDCLQQILNDERGGVLQTVNHYYADTLSSIRRERVLARLEGLGLVDGEPFDRGKVMKGVHLSNDDQAVYDIHDMLKAYYKVAIKRFTDNVVIQITERHILGAEGPVEFLSPDLIGDLSEVQLAELAGENFMTASRRNDLIAKAERVQEALKVARAVAI
ncbi:P-loop containing nucleoside triphosphate hydrolase protein [Penicillium sp. IBT 16267x]|nr:P-loop containing nucleoside triphosphate hydrolase protein [Penicillium sp. IBT 16267x]